MEYIEAPQEYNWDKTNLFLAWWITNCEDWQERFTNYFKDTSLAIMNPRRRNFDVTDSSIEMQQITWEHKHLEKADIISFWFWKETLCPIVLYELWKYINTSKQIFIWIEPGYQRTSDVKIQTQLVRPDLKIVNSLSGLAKQVKNIL